jgi:repressor LexA
MKLRMPASVPPPRVPGSGRPAAAAALVPVVAGVEQGLPVLDAGQIDDVWPLPRQVTGDGTLFILRVPGEAMAGAAIAPWDWVVVRQADDAADGDIVVAALASDTAVRTLRRRGGHTWLVPHHPDYQPLLADDATILGVVTAVLRLV